MGQANGGQTGTLLGCGGKYGIRNLVMVNTVTKPYNHKEFDEFRVDPFDNDIPYDQALK